MIYDNADEASEELFGSLLNKYQIRWETSMGGSDLAFYYFHLLYWKCHKLNANWDGSNIDSPDWIKKKHHNYYQWWW